MFPTHPFSKLVIYTKTEIKTQQKQHKTMHSNDFELGKRKG